MAEAKQMVPGFNHNIKHRGKAYHVQTEDSGLGNPHIITHLFVGGNIIASKKTGYADIVGAENLAQVVRELMEEQHKEMLRNLINGVYDELDEALSAKARAYQPGQLAPRPPPPAAPRVAAATQARPAASSPSGPRAAPPGLNRAAAELAAPAAAPPRAQGGPAPRPPPPAAGRAAPRTPVGAAAAPPPRREGIDTLFGEDLISEKSLDEVILSYLAEDLGGKKP